MNWSEEQLTDMFGDDTIDKLAFTSGCYKHSMNNSANDGWIIPDENLKKFAELIVRECAHVAFNATYPNNGVEVLKAIKEHFGVE